MTNARSTVPTPSNEPVLGYEPGSPERGSIKAALIQHKETKTEIPLYINGERIVTAAKSQVVCPHDHRHVLAEVSEAEESHVRDAIQSNLEARKEWAAMPWEARAAVFLKAADLIAGPYRADINAATMLGQSKTVHQAEIDAACELIDFFRFNVHFMQQILSEQPQSAPGMWNRSEVRGLEGFVYAIAPFNFTSIAINLPTAPALMGCSVLWKPAPTSMHAAWVGMQVLEEAGLPPGVINMLAGNPQTISKVAMKHPELSGIHFTGSTQTFNHLWQEVGNNIGNYRHYPRIVGETGGKDFVFAHKSADVEPLAVALVRGAFEYQGQKCSAASRAYIPKSIWPKLKEQLVSLTNELKVGDVEDFTNFMGAVIDRRAFDKITGYIKNAQKSSDAKVICGGEFDDSNGYFVRPTIIETENPKYPSLVEEIFGPVLTIFPYDDDRFEESLKLCDESTPYALTGGIFAQDRYAIQQMSQALIHAAGNFYINDKPTGAVVGQQPFGGGRASGTNDKAGSMFNLLRWCSHRTIKETFVPPTHYQYGFMSEP
ncbi:MAG: L-glutamate gamma-semialdehyde dehydrogenase [Oligoflexus sp.]